MAQKKSTKKVTRGSRSSKKTSNGAANSRVIAAGGILFAGACVVFLGNLQGVDNLKLLLVGFGAAMLVLGGVLVGMATRPLKK